MVVKKRVKKTENKKIIKKSPSRKLKIPRIRSNLVIVVKNLFLFVFLSVASYFLYKYFFKNYFLISLFNVTAMIFGFMAVGFLIAFLVLITLRIIRLISQLISGKRSSVKNVPVRRKIKSRKKKEVKYMLVE